MLNKTTIRLSRQVIAARIKQLRAGKGLTVLQLARRIRQCYRHHFPFSVKLLVQMIGTVESGVVRIEPAAFSVIVLGLDGDPGAELKKLQRKWEVASAAASSRSSRRSVRKKKATRHAKNGAASP